MITTPDLTIHDWIGSVIDWSVQAKVSRAIKADGLVTVARKCMLTQCANYDYV